MKTDELLLIDLSSLAHPIWHVSQNEPDPNHVSTAIVARVRALATEHPHAAVCCDSGKSFRYDISADYKANRPERLGTLMHQIKLAEETLARDGFPIWKVPGFEADDIIATATMKALAIEDTTVLIASADKDLLQLVNGRVTAKSLTNGSVLDSAAVEAKFSVTPAQMLDYLSLVGDASDNIKGASGIGGVRAAALLKKYGTLENLFRAFDKGATPDITPAQRTNLQEFRPRWQTVRSLIALRTDVPINFEEIAAERTPQVDEMPDESTLEDLGAEQGQCAAYFADAQKAALQITDTVAQKGERAEAVDRPAATAAAPVSEVAGSSPAGVPPSPRTETLPAPVDFTMQLEPRTMPEAITLAKHAFESRLFSAFGTPQAVLTVILAGRELGLQAMASLRSFYVIDGKPTLSADLIAATVLRSGKARYLKCTARSATSATFKTHRVGEDEDPVELTYTIDEARLAWRKDTKAWDASGWGRSPADMLVARAKAKLCRLVYPDVVAGLYDPSEME